MFTGIIQQIGEIKSIKQIDDLVKVSILYRNLDIKNGDSICVEGICSTAKNITEETFDVDYMKETVNKTTVSDWGNNTKLNIEPSLSMKDKISGHFVTGHIDAVGLIKKINKDKNTKEICIGFPKELSKYIALRGSITVDGISLTVSMLESNYFCVSLIPHTIENTTLGNKKVHDKVNIEIDILSRYLETLFNERDKQSSYQFLKERGFI